MDGMTCVRCELAIADERYEWNEDTGQHWHYHHSVCVNGLLAVNADTRAALAAAQQLADAREREIERLNELLVSAHTDAIQQLGTEIGNEIPEFKAVLNAACEDHFTDPASMIVEAIESMLGGRQQQLDAAREREEGLVGQTARLKEAGALLARHVSDGMGSNFAADLEDWQEAYDADDDPDAASGCSDDQRFAWTSECVCGHEYHEPGGCQEPGCPCCVYVSETPMQAGAQGRGQGS